MTNDGGQKEKLSGVLGLAGGIDKITFLLLLLGKTKK